ncbi:MAG: PilX N-terminal domain-containing pilus assembly protein [Pseudomonadota bacterium]
MNRPNPYSSHTARQRGAALFTALIFLLILTILGVFGMNVSRLENLMAGNAQFQTTALNNAEYVLVRGERDLQALADGGGVNPFLAADTTDQYFCANDDSCQRTTGDADDASFDPAALVWTFSSTQVELPDVANDGSDSDGDSNPDDGTGQYVIVDAGYDNGTGECVTQQCRQDTLAGAQVHVFQVTARSNSSRGAKRIVQSAYVTTPLPLIGVTP